MQAEHWNEWRHAVSLGYTEALKIASASLQILDGMTPQQIESLFAAAGNDDAPQMCAYRLKRVY